MLLGVLDDKDSRVAACELSLMGLSARPAATVRACAILLEIRLGRQAGVVVLNHVQHLARLLVLDLAAHCRGRPNVGSRAPAVLDSSLCTVVRRLVARLLPGIPRQVVSLDDIEVPARQLVLELQGDRPRGCGRGLAGSLASLALDTTRRRGPGGGRTPLHEPRT